MKLQEVAKAVSQMSTIFMSSEINASCDMSMTTMTKLHELKVKLKSFLLNFEMWIQATIVRLKISNGCLREIDLYGKMCLLRDPRLILKGFGKSFD